MIIKKSPPGPTSQDHRVPFFSIFVRGGQAPWCHRVVTINLACEEWFPIVIGILRFQPVFLSSLFSSVLRNHISHFIFATRTWSHSTVVSEFQLLYSSLFFLDVLLQRSWPGADTWSILRAAPLNVNSFYLPLVERQHSEVEVAYNMKENPPGSGTLLSRVSRGIWSAELAVLQTHTQSTAQLLMLHGLCRLAGAVMDSLGSTNHQGVTAQVRGQASPQKRIGRKTFRKQFGRGIFIIVQ